MKPVKAWVNKSEFEKYSLGVAPLRIYSYSFEGCDPAIITQAPELMELQRNRIRILNDIYACAVKNSPESQDIEMLLDVIKQLMAALGMEEEK